jgi:type II secretion system protein N
MALALPWNGPWKEIAAWATAGVAALVLSLLATFPYDALHARILAEAQRLTGMEVRVADWAVGMPLGLEWRTVTLSKPAWEPVRLAALEARIGLLKALTGGVGLDLVVKQEEPSAGGLAKGTVTATSWSFAGPVAVKGEVRQVDLSKLVQRYVRHGLLTGDFTHRLDNPQSPAGSLKGEGSWRATVKDLALDQIPIGAGRMLSLAFTSVTAGLACKDEICTVTEMKGDGLDGSFTGEGTVTLQQPLQSSQLALTVTVVPGAGFASKAAALGLPPLPAGTPMTLKVVGPLAQARIAL